MAATITMLQCTGASAGTETTSDYWNLMSTDAVDTSGTEYQSNRISVPDAGTNYSFERWVRFQFTGTFNAIENLKCYHSAGSLSDGNLELNAGETDTGVTPTDTDSAVATTALASWDAEGEAIDVTPAAGISSDGDKSDYLVLQLDVPSTVTTPGDIGAQTMTIMYDES